MMKPTILMMLVGAALGVAGCAQNGPTDEAADQGVTVGAGDTTKVDPGKADASVEAVFVNFDFEGQVFLTSSFNIKGRIEDQLLYTIGHLNGDRSVGRLDKLEVTNIKTEQAEGGFLVTYDARLPVAWGKKNSVPQTYTLIMPRDASFQGLEAFTEKYSHDCVDFGAHDVTAGSMWYYYRPMNFRCKLDEGDVVRLKAEVTLSETMTTGKYPEYNKIWEDGTFNVVAVFGKYDDGATTSSDAGISAYNNFSGLIRDALKNHDLVTVPEVIPSAPGVENPELRFEATLDEGHKVNVTALLVDNVRTAGRDFNARYASLSRDADLIIYNGHAGLGANIRALAQKGDWVPGQYAVVFMNGCDTYAYVDSSLFDAHAAVNDDDDTGTKYMDIVTNAMPSFFRSMPRATMALVNGLMRHDDPQTYEQMFRNVDSSQIILVSGEEDNTFVPGQDDDDVVVPVTAWEGLELGGTVAQNEEVRFETPQLPAGKYTFLMDGTNDADLYIRVGLEPTSEKFDCRPFKSGSSESCTVELSVPATIHGMVRGWAASSSYDLVGTEDR